MFKSIKWLLRLTLVIAIIFAVGFVYYVYIDHGVALSEDQVEMVSSHGLPEQFSISYLPKGSEEGSEFVRHELWYYPAKGQKVSFLNGRVVNIEKLELAEGVTYNRTQLEPSDFDVYTSLVSVENIVGKKNIAPIELPGFFGEGVETYASPGAVFVFENEYLTYMETLD